MAVKEYKKLASHRYFLGRGAKLYLAKDHLLFSESMGYTEDYKRFYFRDIQAVLIRPYFQRMAWNLFWGGLVLLFLTTMLVELTPVFTGSPKKLTEDDHFLIGMGAFGTLFFLLPLLFNTFMGTGCRCHLKTAIQTVQLPIVRRRKAEKILALLTPLIVEAQRNMTEAPAPVPTIPTGFTAPPVPVLAKPFRPHAHWALFSVLSLLALAVVIRFYFQSLPLYLVEMVLNLLAMALVIMALVWQSRGGTPVTLGRLTVAALVCVIVDYLGGISWGMVLYLQHPEFAADQWAMIKWMASQPMDKHLFLKIFSGFEVAFGSLLGVIGLIELGLSRKGKAEHLNS